MKTCHMDHDPGAGFPLLFTTETAITYSSAWWTMPVLQNKRGIIWRKYTMEHVYYVRKDIVLLNSKRIYHLPCCKLLVPYVKKRQIYFTYISRNFIIFSQTHGLYMYLIHQIWCIWYFRFFYYQIHASSFRASLASSPYLFLKHGPQNCKIFYR